VHQLESPDLDRGAVSAGARWGWPRAIFFLKAPSPFIGHGETIQIYREMQSKIQPEGEPAVVIGRRATRVKAADAGAYIAGFRSSATFRPRSSAYKTASSCRSRQGRC